MRNIRFRHKLVFLLSAALFACGQPGPLYLPGTTPPFYVPHEDSKVSEKSEPENKKTNLDAGQSLTKPEPSEPEPEQKQEQLDLPPTQP